MRGRVAFENVSFRYQADPELPWTLDRVNLSVAPGEVVALVGPSGGGKTTLVSLLPRFWDVDQGRITFDGTDIRSLRLAELRSAIGIVPQDPALFSGTIRENIAYARPDASPADVEAAARAAHAQEFVERLPLGYETAGRRAGDQARGGQRQRVAIARAILKNPAVLILDEATSNLDTESERLIEDALSKLLVGRTTLIIAHRLSTVQRADRLWWSSTGGSWRRGRTGSCSRWAGCTRGCISGSSGTRRRGWPRLKRANLLTHRDGGTAGQTEAPTEYP